MTIKFFKKCIFIFIILSFIDCNASDINNTPCTGPDNLLSLINRPTMADSACVTPNKDIILEMGYEYQTLNGKGNAHILPFGQFRLGLPLQTEFTIIAPSYIHQTIYPSNGLSTATVGLKHTLAAKQTWITSIELLVTPPSGSNAFGSSQTGAAFNSILSYNINENFNLTAMLGASSQVQSHLQGDKRSFSINPDIVFTWEPKSKLDIFAEIYGQTKTAPNQGAGYNFDTGIIYLLRKNMTVDAEIGHRLIGNLYGFKYYLGVGMAIQIV